MDRPNRCPPRWGLPYSVQSACSSTKWLNNPNKPLKIHFLVVRQIWREINSACFCLQVPPSQESDLGVQGASPDITTTAEQIRSLVDEQLTTSLQKMLPSLLNDALKTSENSSTTEQVENCSMETQQEQTNFSPPVSRLNQFYNTTNESVLPDEVLEVIKTAFSKQLSKDIWSDLMEKYPVIKGTEEILVAPIMETGTKEYMRQKFGHHKTEDVLASDEGLAEDNHPF